jgi:hypothetical protein
VFLEAARIPFDGSSDLEPSGLNASTAEWFVYEWLEGCFLVVPRAALLAVMQRGARRMVMGGDGKRTLGQLWEASALVEALKRR